MIIMTVGTKTHELVIWKMMEIKFISYLKMKRARQLVYLQFEGVRYVTYPKPEKACAFLKICVCSRRDAREVKYVEVRSLAKQRERPRVCLTRGLRVQAPTWFEDSWISNSRPTRGMNSHPDPSSHEFQTLTRKGNS